MLNHLTLGQSLIKSRLDAPARRSRHQHKGESYGISWLHHKVSDMLRPLPRR